MLTFLRASYRNQIGLLAATGAVVWWVTTTYPYTPVVRAGGATLLQGAVSGALAAVCLALLLVVLVLFAPGFRGQWSAFTASAYRGSPFHLAGAALATVIAEEVLVRGLLFGWLERLSLPAAFAANAAVAALIWLQSPRRPWPPVIKAIEGSMYAVFFWYNRSLFMVVAAHALVEALAAVAFRAGRGESRKEPAVFRVADWIADEIRSRFGIKLKRRSANR